MGIAKQNLAYDLSLFEPRENKTDLAAYEEVKEAKKRLKIQKPHLTMSEVLKSSTAAIIVMVTITLVMLGNISLNEINIKIERSQKSLTVAKSEGVRLNTQLESRMSLKNVEEQAINKLGLKKINRHQIEYINLNDKDETVIIQNKSNVITDFFGGIINRFMEYFRQM